MVALKQWSAGVLMSTALTLGYGSFSGAIAAPGSLTGTSCASGTVMLGGGSYTACEGAFDGNDTGNKGTLLTKLNTDNLFADVVGSGTWTLLDKSDGGALVQADNGATAGDWQADLSNIQDVGAVVVSLKSSTSYSTYLFTENLQDILKGTFTMDGVSLNKKGKAQALSHLSVAYFRRSTPVVESQPVNEPGSLLGMGAVALGGVLLGRRRSLNTAAHS
jgi:hypothetical protein